MRFFGYTIGTPQFVPYRPYIGANWNCKLLHGPPRFKQFDPTQYKNQKKKLKDQLGLVNTSPLLVSCVEPTLLLSFDVTTTIVWCCRSPRYTLFFSFSFPFLLLPSPLSPLRLLPSWSSSCAISPSSFLFLFPHPPLFPILPSSTFFFLRSPPPWCLPLLFLYFQNINTY